MQVSICKVILYLKKKTKKTLYFSLGGLYLCTFHFMPLKVSESLTEISTDGFFGGQVQVSQFLIKRNHVI